MEIKWESVAAIIAAVSTGTIATMSISRHVISWLRRRRHLKLTEQMELCPEKRIEIVHVSSFQESIMRIRVRNRSEVPVSLDIPIFEIRGQRSHLPGSIVQEAHLGAGETHSFLMEFPGDVSDACREECILVDTGRPDQA